ILSIFDFDIEYIKGDSNSVPDLLTREFLQNRFFKPHNTDKTVLFFQTILEITESVSFKHFYSNENHTDPAYSTFKIYKVIAPSDWEYDLNENLNFPENLKDLSFFQIFKTNFIPSENEKKFPPLALFHSKFHFPWVFSWNLEFSPDPIPIIMRKFRVKWWDKFKIPSNLYPFNILEWIKIQNSNSSVALIQTPNKNQTPETTFFLAQKSKMLSMLAAAKSEEEIKVISLQFMPSISDSISQTSGSGSESNIP
ncbi:hypothetical protein EUTSA_v10002933mg, partial [Eutrema salsugineum]